MKRKMLVVTCIAVVFLAASVTAHASYQSDTPLYTIRMEQASSKMHFLPTEMTAFTYTAYKGCTIKYDITVENTNTTPDGTWFYNTCIHNTCTWPTCKWLTCDFFTCNYKTCGGDTCYLTCGKNTCWPFCQFS